jgi:hypothetical protein
MGKRKPTEVEAREPMGGGFIIPDVPALSSTDSDPPDELGLP